MISGHWLVGNVLPTVGVLRLDRTHRETAEQSLESRHVLLNRLAAGLLTEAAVTGVAAGLKDDDRSLGVLIPYARFQPTAGGAVGTNQTSRQQAQTRRFFRPGLLYAGRFTGAVARLAR